MKAAYSLTVPSLTEKNLFWKVTLETFSLVSLGRIDIMPLLVVREVEKVKVWCIFFFFKSGIFSFCCGFQTSLGQKKGDENAMSWHPIVISLNQLLCPTVFDLVSIIFIC